MISANSHRSTGGRGMREQSRRVVDDVKGLGTIAKENVFAGRNRLKARGKEMLADGREAIGRYQGEVKKYVAANPFKTICMAIGVGALLGLALRRRD